MVMLSFYWNLTANHAINYLSYYILIKVIVFFYWRISFAIDCTYSNDGCF